MKKTLYWILGLFLFCGWADLVWSQEIQKGGKKPTSFTYDEALEMLKARDAQWEGKLAKADSLIESQKIVIADGEKLITELEEYSKVESVLSDAKSKQIQLLQSRDKTNEELIKTLQPKWYQNQYLWLAIGFILGKV